MWNATFDISLNKELTNFNMFVTLDSVHGAPHESVVNKFKILIKLFKSNI